MRGGSGAHCVFVVPGTPVAKGRARAFIRSGHIGHHTPDKTVKYEARVAIFAKQAMALRPPMAGAVMLSVTAHFPIPASWSKKRQAAARSGLEQVTKKPDLDNVLKAIKDGMNGVVWLDDAQVVRLVDCCKVYSDEPRVEVFAGEVL